MIAYNKLPISLQELERAKPLLNRTERQTLDALLTPALLFRIQYKYDPAAFAHDCFMWREGEGPTPYQTEILEELVPRGRIAIRGPHGLGKTALIAWIILWSTLTSDDCKVPVTASAWRQLQYYAFPELHKWATRLNWEKLGRQPFDQKTELLKLSLHTSPGSMSFAVACENSATIEGCHAQRVTYIFDEAKRLGINTSIPTPAGWTTMGDLKIGDIVFDEMGKPTRVTYASPVVYDRPCSLVTFNDGSQLVTDPGHLWATLSHRKRQMWGKRYIGNSRYRYERPRVKDWRTYWDRADIVETSNLIDPEGRRAIPTCRPLELPEKDLPIDPYVLGAWLGDGTARKATITTMDGETLKRIAAAGHKITQRTNRPGAAQTYGIVYGGLETALRELDLLQNKHIPGIYFRASIEQRLALLHGLMDTDGTSMSKKAMQGSRVSFTSTNRALAEGVAELVRMFGWKVRVRESQAKLNGRVTGPVYILRWSADTCPFYIQRKVSRWMPREVQASRSTIRTVISVEPTQSVPTRCIAVDSARHLYLAGKDFIPTHNTIPAATFDAAEGAFSMAGDDTPDEAFALAASTPGEPVGRFHDIHARKPGYEDWWTRHVTKDETMAAGRMSLQWANQRRRQWGEGSPLYQNRVLGEFAEQLADGVIPLAYVEKAQQRWLEWQDAGFPGTFTGLGVDIGGGTGGDPSTLARCYGKVKIKSIEVRAWARDPDTATMELTGRVKGILDAHGGYAIIDGIGIGAPVVHRGREQNADFRSFIASGGNDLHDQTGEISFANNRAALWWLARELLADEANGVCLPPDDVVDPSGEMSLAGELISPKWKELSNGRILIESKKDIKKRIGRSTNLADACLQILTGPRVLGSFEAPSVGNLANEMERLRAVMAGEMAMVHVGASDHRSRVGVAIASDEEPTRSDPMATLRYIGPYVSVTIFLDRKPYLVDPGWSRQVDLPLAMEVVEGLPELFTMGETGEIL